MSDSFQAINASVGSGAAQPVTLVCTFIHGVLCTGTKLLLIRPIEFVKPQPQMGVKSRKYQRL